MSPGEKQGTGREPDPRETGCLDADQGASYADPSHEVYMAMLADRIAWLEGGHEHWWRREQRWRREREAA